VAVSIVAMVAVAAGASFTLRGVVADSLLAVARSPAAAGLDGGISALRRAISLVPGEPTYELQLGRALTDAARQTTDPATRDRLMSEARASLEAARAHGPLDPDHPANLGRLAAIEADTLADPSAQMERLTEAEKQFEQALVLRPPWVRLLAELAIVEHRLGHRDEAFHRIDQALALDTRDPLVYRALSHLHARDAAFAVAAGDAASAKAHETRATQALQRAFDIESQRVNRVRWGDQ
jgi:tetratricopeptide (TPR) repeat protein